MKHVKSVGVLVVDDEVKMRTAIKRYVELFDHCHIHEAEEAQGAAQAFLENDDIQIVISDMQMAPGANGDDLYLMIKEEVTKRNALFMIFSGAPREARTRLASERDVSVFAKPRDTMKVMDAVEEKIAEITT